MIRPHPRGGAQHRAGRRSGTRTLPTLVLLAVALAAAACGTPTGDAHPPAPDSYGGMPTYLPADTDQPDSTLTGTVDHPALTVEGDAVRVQLADATVQATVSGPVVPGEGLPYETPATTCTWTITLVSDHADVPLSMHQFSTLDHLGAVYAVTTAPGQPDLPTSVRPGHPASFELRAVMPTGEGLFRWAPDGLRVAASWDFEVEND